MVKGLGRDKVKINPNDKTLDYLDRQYSGSFFIRNVCQDLEIELHNAGLQDPSYFEKRIVYCREFCDFFPEEDELILHNMRRAIASSYAKLGKYEQADREFKQLVQDYPHNPWAYIAWGDSYYFGNEDYKRARDLYTKGLAIAKDEFDMEVLEERLEDLESAMGRKE